MLGALGAKNIASLYTLRGSVTTSMKRANLPHLEMKYLTSHSIDDIMNVYTSLDPVGAMKQYFDTIQPLLMAITERATVLGLTDTPVPATAIGTASS